MIECIAPTELNYNMQLHCYKGVAPNGATTNNKIFAIKEPVVAFIDKIHTLEKFRDTLLLVFEEMTKEEWEEVVEPELLNFLREIFK